MSEEIVKRHNFEAAKKNIESFSKNLPTSIFFPKFEEDGGLFGWGDHKVTGSEMNKFLTKLQGEFIEFNSGMRKVFGQFKEIYIAFDSLDKDYINGILIAVGSAAESSKQAKAASDKANLACADINKTIVALRATVDKLKEFKSTTQKNIERIDKEIKSISSNVTILALKQSSSNRENLRKDLDQAIAEISSLQQYRAYIKEFFEVTERKETEFSSDIVALKGFQSKLDAFCHLCDIDITWADVELLKEQITDAAKNLSSFKGEVNKANQEFSSKIKDLQSFQDVFWKYEHLCDIDKIWLDVQRHEQEISKASSEFGEYVAKTTTQFSLYQENMSALCSQFESSINSLQQYQNSLKSLEHLHNIDGIWSDVQKHRKQIDEATKTFSSYVESASKAFGEYKTEQAQWCQRIKDIQTRTDNEIKCLEEYRSRLQSIEHILDIDEIWSDVQNHRNQIDEAERKFSSYTESAANVFGEYKSEQVQRFQEVHDIQAKTNTDIKSLEEYRSRLQSIEHILDIDEIWQDLRQHRIDIDTAGKLFSEYVENAAHAFSSYKQEIVDVQCRIDNDLLQLKSFQEKLESYEHTYQIDELWEFSHELNMRTETLANLVDAEIQRIDSALVSEQLRVKKRLMVSYVVGGTALAVAITHFVLNIFGVL